MFFLNKNSKMIFYTKPVNLHKGYDRLAVIVQTELGLELTPGLYFLFCNQKKDRVKVLYLDGTNLAIWSKRLDATLSFSYEEKSIVFDQKAFVNFLNKIVFRRPFKRYNLPEKI